MNDELPTVAQGSLADSFDKSARPVLAVDIRKYQTLLDRSDLNEKQKEEFLRALWSIVVTFVELGFGVHPLQEVCGKSLNKTVYPGRNDSDKVELKELTETLTT